MSEIIADWKTVDNCAIQTEVKRVTNTSDLFRVQSAIGNKVGLYGSNV